MSFSNAFNETQSSIGSQDRKLRYKALLEDLSTLDEENENDVELFVDKTASIVKGAQALFVETDVEDRIKHPGEGYLDSRVLRAASDLAVRCTETVSGNFHTYDKHELALHIHENPDFWSFSFPGEVPVVAYLFGTFAPTPPEQRPRAPRRHVEKQQAAALKAPQNIDRIQKTDEGPQMVNKVYRFIKHQGRPISYFHLVLHPGSFSTTIEYIYYVSFLVQDAMISIDLDEQSGLPFIKPVLNPQPEQENLANKNQFIVSMDRKRWQELIEAFGIEKPMMT